MAQSKLEIYGNPISQPSRSVIIFCKFSKIPHTFHEVEFLAKRENTTPEYMKISPFQEIPALVHGKFNVWESPAMVTYLADAFDVDNQWYPKNIQIRARINSYLHWHHQNIRTPLINYTLAKIILPRFFGGKEIKPEVEAKHKENIGKLLESVAWMLKSTGNIARTSQLTIADVFCFSELAGAMMIPIDLTPFPIIQEWFQRIRTIPEVLETHAMIFEVASGMNPKI